MHAARRPRRARCRSRCRPQTREMMRFSATAAAAALARPRSSSSRFVPTTFVTCKHRAEAQGASRHTTEDLFEVREGLRFDVRGLRTLSSSRLIKVQAPTSLDTELELEGDSVAVPRAPTALLRPRAKGSSRGQRRPRPRVYEQPPWPSGCSCAIAGSQGPPQPEKCMRGAAPESSQGSIII